MNGFSEGCSKKLSDVGAGMNQLLWYYADLEKQKCLEDDNGDGDNSPGTDFYAHLGGRRSNKVLWAWRNFPAILVPYVKSIFY